MTDYDLPSEQRIALRKARKKIGMGGAIAMLGLVAVFIPFRIIIVVAGLVVVASGFIDESKVEKIRPQKPDESIAALEVAHDLPTPEPIPAWVGYTVICSILGAMLWFVVRFYLDQ